MKGGRGEYHCYRNLGNVSSSYLPLRDSQLISVLKSAEKSCGKEKMFGSVSVQVCLTLEL